MRLAVLCLLAITAACAGPKTPIEVGVKEFPVNILLGGTDKPVTARVLPASDPTLDIPVIPPAPKVRAKPVETPAGPCPEFHPFAGPKVVATNRARNAPVEGTYTFRHTGTDGYPAETTRKVTNINTDTTFGTDP